MSNASHLTQTNVIYNWIQLRKQDAYKETEYIAKRSAVTLQSCRQVNVLHKNSTEKDDIRHITKQTKD